MTVWVGSDTLLSMAEQVNYNYPVDVPAIEKQGVMHKEDDAPFNVKFLTVPPENPIRSHKGDLPMTTIADFDPHPLSHEGVPWKGLKR